MCVCVCVYVCASMCVCVSFLSPYKLLLTEANNTRDQVAGMMCYVDEMFLFLGVIILAKELK